MKTTKKFLSILLAILMIATSVPFAFAADDDCDHVYNENGQCTVCYEWCPNREGHFTMEENVCPICKYSKLTYSLTSNGVTTEYVSFSDAIAEAKDGDTIKMLKNTAPFSGNGTIDKAIIFDLNGHSFETPGSDSITINANVTLTDSSADKSGYFGYGLVVKSPCKIESGNFWYLMNETDSKYADFLATSCAKYYDSDSNIIDPDNGDNLWNFSVKSNHTPKNNFEGICSACGKFYGTELSLGDNAISKSYIRNYSENKYALRFVPAKTGTYLLKGSKTGKDYYLSAYNANLVYIYTYYSNKNDYTGITNYDYYNYYELEAGKAYYFSLQSSKEKIDSTLSISLVCEHSGTTASCQGYICDKCDRYFGEVGDHRLKTEQTCMGYKCKDCGFYFGEEGDHRLETEQTCMGYKCKDCKGYFGEKAPNNHVWSANTGMCFACYTSCKHESYDQDGVCSVCKYALPFALISNGTTTSYGSFTDALAAAKDGDTIKLQKDLYSYSNETFVEITKAITFDLNGHVVTKMSSEQFDVKANVNFTDSIGGGYCEYGLNLYTTCTFSGGAFRFIGISFETEDNLGDYLAPCCNYYNYSYEHADRVGTVGDLIDLSNVKNTYGITTSIMIKANHTTVDVEAQEATCTEYGNSAGKKCEKCDYTTVTKTDPTGHSFTSVPAKAANCTEDGNSAYKYCETCKKYFDENADVKALGGADTNEKYIIAATGHNFVDEITQTTKADCLNAGYKECKQCTKCKDYFEVDEDIYSENGRGIDVFIEMATGHKFGDTVEVKAATCYEDGVKTAYKQCERCKLYFDESANVAAKDGKVDNSSYIIKTNGHNYSTINVVEPTCTEKGYTEHICVCGYSYKDTYVDASGHNYVNGTCACGAKDPNYKDGDNTTTDCDCICHSSSGFVQFIFKIVNWFWKILGWHKTCDCGAVHY